MPFTRRNRRSLATLLAALYVLVGAVGEGLHGLTHPRHEDQQAAAGCGCGASHCVFAARAKAAKDHFAGFSARPSGGAHDPHSCGVCQALSVLKVSSGTHAPRLVVSVAPPVWVAAAATPSVAAPRYDHGARGPPVA